MILVRNTGVTCYDNRKNRVPEPPSDFRYWPSVSIFGRVWQYQKTKMMFFHKTKLNFINIFNVD